jgi:hypothetical protein
MAQSQTRTVVDNGALAAIGAAIVGFGIVAFCRRLTRRRATSLPSGGIRVGAGRWRR